MKMYLISDNIDTLTGMRLAGVEGEVVHGRREASGNGISAKYAILRKIALLASSFKSL